MYVMVPKVYGVGVDITRVNRLQRFFEGNEYKRNAFLTRIFHPTELEEFNKRSEEGISDHSSPRL